MSYRSVTVASGICLNQRKDSPRWATPPSLGTDKFVAKAAVTQPQGSADTNTFALFLIAAIRVDSSGCPWSPSKGGAGKDA